MKGLARAGEGEAEFIAPGERIEAKVLRQLSRALAPAFTEVSVDWGGLAVTQAPHEVPPVFADGRVLLFARLEKPAPATVTLRATGPGRAGELRAAARPGRRPPRARSSRTLWARRMIRDLEEGRSPLHPRRGSQQARALGLKDEPVKDEIVRLGTTWASSPATRRSWPSRSARRPTEGEAQLRKVPVAITRGWHGLGKRRQWSRDAQPRCLRHAGHRCRCAPPGSPASRMWALEDAASATPQLSAASLVRLRGGCATSARPSAHRGPSAPRSARWTAWSPCSAPTARGRSRTSWCRRSAGPTRSG